MKEEIIKPGIVRRIIEKVENENGVALQMGRLIIFVTLRKSVRAKCQIMYMKVC